MVLATAGSPLRFTEYDACAKLASELFTVSEGAEWQGTHWRCDAPLSGTINTTAVPFQLIDDIGSLNILTPADLDATQSIAIYDPGVTAARPLRNLQVNAREMTNVHLIGLTENAVPAIDAAANEFATLTTNDALPLVIDGALRQIDPVALQEFVLGTPWKLDATGELDATAVIQAKADAMLVYAEVTGFGASATTDIARPVGIAEITSSTLLGNPYHNAFLRCANSTGPITITLPSATTLRADFVCYVAAMGSRNVMLDDTAGSSSATIGRRFQAKKIARTGSTYTITDLDVIGGGTLRLPAGVFRIDGPGLKWHPANDLVGTGLGGTVLMAASTLNGAQDPGGSTRPALLTIAARSHPLAENAGDPIYSWQPTLSGFIAIGQAVDGGELDPDDTVSGCVIENGQTDPAFDSAGPEYKASSGRFIACAFYRFPGHGVYSEGERQRFYCQHLRCTNNGGYGLKILGSDPVIGERTGLGGNGLHQLSCTGNAGVIVNGVNMFKGDVRSDDCLACEIRNVNGCTITGSVFNDTLLLDGDPVDDLVNKGISVTGCDFRPNDNVFGDDDLVLGGSPEYNAYIHVSGLANVTIANNSFCVQARGLSFDYIVYAQDRARLLLQATISTETIDQTTRDLVVKNFSADYPIAVSSTTQPAVINYDLTDIYTGTRYTGTLGGPPGTYPQFRGTPLFSVAETADYEGYRIVDGGPALQGYSPEYTDEAAQFIDVTTSSAVISPSARIAYLLLPSAGLASLAVQLPVNSWHRHLKIVFRGGDVTNLSWVTGTGAVLADAALMPTRVSQAASIELIRRRAAPGGDAIWYLLQTERLSTLIRVGDDSTRRKWSSMCASALE